MKKDAILVFFMTFKKTILMIINIDYESTDLIRDYKVTLGW